MQFTRVWCTFSVVGFHKWPQAPREVSYLRSAHRHVFHFKVTVSVPHPDRAIEFHTLKAHVSDLVLTNYNSSNTVEGEQEHLGALGALDFEERSCEQIAAEVIYLMLDKDYIALVQKYADREITVEVSEDGENGGVVEYIPEVK